MLHFLKPTKTTCTIFAILVVLNLLFLALVFRAGLYGDLLSSLFGFLGILPGIWLFYLLNALSFHVFLVGFEGGGGFTLLGRIAIIVGIAISLFLYYVTSSFLGNRLKNKKTKKYVGKKTIS